MLRKYIDRIRYSSRKKKLDQLFEYLSPNSKEKILEVGVANKEYSPVDNFLIRHYPFKDKITALGIGDLSEFRRRYPEIRTINYNGQTFPFTDREFDVAHSNAVIEHLGNADAQEEFLREIVRVSSRGMVTTPNKYFYTAPY